MQYQMVFSLNKTYKVTKLVQPSIFQVCLSLQTNGFVLDGKNRCQKPYFEFESLKNTALSSIQLFVWNMHIRII